ncbi:MAG: sugar phosphorylase, partial [Deltaproteobacteria bacterium]|nr:sugar phosphorylase [Candidatus Tharpellaceae bacterium]
MTSDKNSSHTPIMHEQEPDYTRPLYHCSDSVREKLRRRLAFIYDEETAEYYLPEMERILQVYYAHKPPGMIEA